MNDRLRAPNFQDCQCGEAEAFHFHTPDGKIFFPGDTVRMVDRGWEQIKKPVVSA